MIAEIDDSQLRRFVVRIHAADAGATLGTGVLVAPGRVLTCAHVVEGHDEVRVLPDRGAGVGGAEPPEYIQAVVRARSAARDPGQGSAFWPFPDLALLEFGGWTGHVCAPLVAEDPARTSEPHAWGFGQREDGVASPGVAASFTYVGSDGDGYLSLKAGDAAPGLSGAPLVCPHRRGVVGLASVSRDPRDARGGWASPVSGLVAAGLPEELAGAARQVLALNRDLTWQYRDDWNRALPVPAAELTVDRPWTGIEFDRTAAPSLLLRAEFGVVDYSFRQADLAAARDWCRARPRFAISYIDAQGGAGKTRFGIELCKTLSADGWVTGFLPGTDRGVAAVPLPRLVVVDYIEEREAQILAGYLSSLERSATPLAPVRILLLSRPAGGSLAGQVLEPLREQPTISGAVRPGGAGAAAGAAATSGLLPGDRDELFRAALTAFGRAWHGTGWSPPAATEPDLAPERYARPLDVLLEAFDAALTGPGWQPDARPPVDRALDHEARHWAARMPTMPAKTRRKCVALATLAGARDNAEATALLGLVPDLSAPQPSAIAPSQADEWLRGLYQGPDRWNPLRPDRLGEALSARVIAEQEDGGRDFLGAVLDLVSDPQAERLLDVVVRLAADPAVASVIADVLADRYSELVERCIRQARGVPGSPGRAGLLDGLTRAHLALLTDTRVSTLPLAAQAQISAAADLLADLARDYGRSPAALAIFESALAIDERRVELEPGNTTYRRDLSVSYEQLADLALAAGRSAEAEGLYGQSLAVRQELAELEPGNTTYRRDLSVSYERLGQVAIEAGQAEEAQRCLTVAVSTRRELHRQEPQRADLAEELGVTFYLLTGTGGDPASARQEIIDILTPFEHAATITPKGISLLSWARQQPAS